MKISWFTVKIFFHWLNQRKLTDLTVENTFSLMKRDQWKGKLLVQSVKILLIQIYRVRYTFCTYTHMHLNREIYVLIYTIALSINLTIFYIGRIVLSLLLQQTKCQRIFQVRNSTLWYSAVSSFLLTCR